MRLPREGDSPFSVRGTVPLSRASLCAVLSGAGAVAVAPPYGRYPLLFVTFVPLLLAVRFAPPDLGVARRCARAAFAGWLTGVVFYAGICPWIPSVIARSQGVGPGAALALAASCVAYHALQFALAAGGIALILRGRADRGLVSAVAVASWWVLLERGFPKIVPWSVGNGLGPAPWLRQGADLFGLYGLGFVVMLVNACVAEAVSARRRAAPLGAALAVLALASAYGAWRARDAAADGEPEAAAAPGTDGSPGLTIAIIQGGLPAGDGDIERANETSWATYAALTEPLGAESVDLVVWPESVLRVFLRDNDAYEGRIRDLTAALRRPLLLGALDRPVHGVAEFNSAYLFSPATPAAPPAVYHKAALLPFGEYAPGADWWDGPRRWRTTGAFAAGEAPAPLRLAATPDLLLAPSICFEATVPGWFNAMVRGGAAFLVNLTDDSWFASARAAAQHIELARLRAVETRRWLVRASNSGVSAFIDPAGRLVATLPLGAAGTLRGGVVPRETLTPYVRFGDWIAPACAVYLLAWIAACSPALPSLKPIPHRGTPHPRPLSAPVRGEGAERAGVESSCPPSPFTL